MSERQPLRPHQVTSIEAVDAAHRAGKMRVVLQAPTAAGKTRMAAEWIMRARQEGHRVLFIAPAIILIDQTVDRLIEAGVPMHDIGVMQAQHPLTNPFRPIQVASAQTLGRRQRPDFDLCVVDEAHHQFASVLGLLKAPENKGRRFIGLSATPWAAGMGKHWDELVVGSTIQTLTQEGWLKPIRYYAPMSIDTRGVRMSAGDFNLGDLSEASNKRSILANTVQQWIERGENRPTIAYCVDRNHAKAMQERFTESGIPCEYIDANTPPEERKAIERRLQCGQSKVVASVGTLIAGVDWPFISCVLHARKTKSHIFLIQTIGRGLRTHPDYKDCIVIDCAGNTDLGHPYDINFPNLDDGKRGDAERRKRLKRDIPEPSPCQACGHQRARGERTCSACGHTPPALQIIKEGNADLGIFERGGSAKKSATKYDTPAWRQIWYSSLLAIQRDRGYKPGWVANQYREKYGEWPEKTLCQDPASYPDPVVASWVRSRMIRYAKTKAKGGA